MGTESMVKEVEMDINQYLSMTSKELIKDFLTEIINHPLEGLKKIEEISKKERYQTDYEFRTTIETIRGIAFSILGKVSEAISLITRLIDTATSLKLWELVARNWNTMGITYMNIGVYEKAVECFHKVVKTEQKYELLRVTASAYSNIGIIFLTYNIYDRARKYFELAEETLKKGGKNQVRYYADLQLYYTNLAHVHANMENLEKVAHYLSLVEEMGIEKSKARLRNGYYFTKMIYHFCTQDYEKGKKVYFVAKENFGEDNLYDAYTLTLKFIEICDKYNLKDELYEKELLRLEKFQEIDYNLTNIFTYSRLREYYLEKKNTEKVCSITEKYVEFLEKEFDSINKRQGESIVTVDEMMSKEDEMEGMRHKNTELELVVNETIKHKNSLQKAYQQIDLINKLGKKLTSSLKLNEVIELIYENVIENIPTDIFILMVKNEEKEEVLDTIAYYEDGKLKENISVDLKTQKGFIAECYHKNKIVSTYDEEYLHFFEEQKMIQKTDMNSAIYMPLNVDDETIGICSVQDRNSNAYTDEKIEFLNELLPYLSIALNNAIRSRNLEKEIQSRLKAQVELEEANKRLEILSSLDSLTQIYGRRRFSEKLLDFIEEAKRTDQTISVMMLDIDSFKLYNDNYGHLEGDEILKKVAAVFRDDIEENGGIAARFGGEEFIASCIGLSFEENMQLAEKIRKDIFGLGLPHEHSVYKRISASIGFYVTKDVSMDRKNEMIKKADECLYEAKELGRNKVVGKES